MVLARMPVPMGDAERLVYYGKFWSIISYGM